MVFIHSFTWFSGPHSESEGSRRPAAIRTPQPASALQLLEQHTEMAPRLRRRRRCTAPPPPVPSKYYNDVLLESYSQLVLHSLLLLQRQPRRHHHGSSNVSVFEKKSTKIVICRALSLFLRRYIFIFSWKSDHKPILVHILLSEWVQLIAEQEPQARRCLPLPSLLRRKWRVQIQVQILLQKEITQKKKACLILLKPFDWNCKS